MRDDNRGYHRRHQTTNLQSTQYANTSTNNKEYITNRYNSDNDENESYPSVGKDIIVTCNKKRNMPPRDRGQIDYSRDRGIDYDKQRKARGTNDDYTQYNRISYQREPSGTISKSYHREPSGMRISQLMDEERQPQNDNRDDYPYNTTARDEYRDNVPTKRQDDTNKEEVNDDSWEISSRITSISNARSSSFPNNHEGIPKSIPTKIRTNKSKGGVVDCNASRMTGWTGHTGVTPLVNNLEITKTKKKHNYEQGRVDEDREDQYRQEEDKVLRTRSTTNNKPPRPSVARSPSPILPTLTKTHDGHGHSNYNRESSNTGSGGSSNNSGIKKMLTNVSSITGWSPDKQQSKLVNDEDEQQDVGIDPARGSFDLVIIPKEKRRQKKQVAMKQLTAVEAASVASETVHHKPQQQVMNNLTYWSSLSVKAAMAVISSDTKNGSDEEKMAQIAANAVLEAGREYDSSVNTTNIKNRKKERIKVDLKDVATKVSVAILESGGDHTVATAVAVAIMNEKATTSSPKDQGSDSSVSTEVAVNTSDGVQGPTANINEALSSSITTKDTTTASASIFSRNRWNNRKSKSATDDSIRAAAARGVKKAGQGRNYSDWQLQVDRRNSELGGGFDRQSVTASMASKRRELEAKEAEIISRNQALEAAAHLNQQKEAEIQQRLQELNTTTQKQQQLKLKEDEIKLKNEQLETAARANEQLEIEIKQRMLALDEATNALLVRAENVQNEINTRVTAPNNGQQQQAVVSSLGRVDEGNKLVDEKYQQQQQQQYEYDPRPNYGYDQSRGNMYDPHNSNGYHQQQSREDQPREGAKADGEISVYTNQADYGQQQSRFDLIQQGDHLDQKQRHERSQSDPSRLKEQTDKSILEQISDKLYSIIDDANLCDTSCAEPSTLRPGENSVTQRRPSYHNMDPASSFGSSLPMNKPTISGLTTQEDQHRTWSNWFGKSNNMPKSQQESSHLPPVHAVVNQSLNQPHKMQQTNPSQQLPEYKSPSEMVDLNQALVQAMNQRDHTNNVQPTDKALDEALKQAMGQAHGFEFQPISHNIQQESSMLSSTSKVGGLSTKLKSRFKKQKNTTTAQPPQEGSNKKRFFSLARRKTAK